MLDGARGVEDGLEERTALPRDVVRVLDWSRTHRSEPAGLDSLATIAGVPPRTLERHFKEFLRTTPTQWVRSDRLARARQALIASGGRETVAAVAFASGFRQLGRFAAEYCRRFGEMPSDTLRRLRSARPDELEDVDDEAIRLAWRSVGAAFQVAPAPCRTALEDVERAQELAPAYALPKAIAAWCLGQRAAQRFGATPHEDSVRAIALAEEASRLAPADSLVLTLASGAFTLAHRVELAGRAVDRALALEPHSPWAWIRRAWTSAYLGNASAAVQQFTTTLHLMPIEPIRHLAFIGIGCAHFVAGDHGRAARWALAGVEANPDSFWAARVIAAAAAHSGSRDEARRVVRAVLRKDPSLTATAARRAWPFPPRVMDRLADGLVRAGLPRD